uniref:G-protein coupled receptors family 1 profile domain-containing protein n=1 Tax=Ditylenchus dipsaci TaxID=166011 RepID=A0A915E4A4_9BILA
MFCKKYQVNYKKEDDNFPASILAVGCAFTALLLNQRFEFLEIAWTFSIYLEAVALVPQLWMSFKQKEKVDPILAVYMIMMCSYRAFYIVNWIYRYNYESFYDPIAFLAGTVETFITGTALITLFVCWNRDFETDVDSGFGKSLPIYTLSVPALGNEKNNEIFGKKTFEKSFPQENQYVRLLNPLNSVEIDDHAPSVLHYLFYWNADGLDYNGTFAVVLELPLMLQLKVYLILTASIALDRVQALRFAVYYRKKRPMVVVIQTLIFGIFLCCIDYFFLFYFSTPHQHCPNCATFGCFVTDKFKELWGFSTMVANFIMLTIVIFATYEVRNYRKERCGDDHAPTENNSAYNKGVVMCENLTKTNRLAMATLVVSALFLMVPSTFVAVTEIFLDSLFGLNTDTAYFFIPMGLLLAGICHSALYMLFHIQLRTVAKKKFKKLFKKRCSKVEARMSLTTAKRTSSLPVIMVNNNFMAVD